MRPGQRLILSGGAKRDIPFGIVRWDPVSATEPNYGSISSGTYIWQNAAGTGLRTNYHYTGTGFSIPTIHSRKRFGFYVNPRSPAAGVDEYHYRVEVSRGWETGLALGTRECVAFDVIIPNAGLLNQAHDIDFFQFHTGSAPGEESNDPVIFGCFSKAGVEDDDDDVSQAHEIVIVNKVRDFEQSPGNPGISGRFNTGIVPIGGDRHAFRMYIQSGINGTGRFTIEHCKKPLNSVWTAWAVIYDEIESTAWANTADGGSNANVHPDFKAGIYCPGLRTLAGVQAAEALNSGSYHIQYYISAIESLIMTSSHYNYSTNCLPFLDTTSIP